MIKLIAKIAIRLGIDPKEAERFAKFLVVGTLGFVIDFGTLTILVELIHLPVEFAARSGLDETVGLVISNTISFTLAVISNFSLNRYWTYPESRSKRKRVQLPQFSIVSVIGLALNNFIFALTTRPFDSLLGHLGYIPEAIEGYILAKVLATVVVLFWNFFINRYWTFGNVE